MHRSAYKIVSFLLFALSFLRPVSAVDAPPCAPAPAGLLAWWTANSPAAGEILGRVTYGPVEFVPGKVGLAFRFPGNNPLSPNGSQDFDLQTLSVEAWIRRLDVAHTSPDWAVYPVGRLIGFSDGWNFSLSHEGKLTLASGGEIVAQSTAMITDLAYHHVAFAKDGAAIAFYIDGAPAGGGTFDGFFRRDANLLISSHPQRAPFLGEIDEISIYSRAISAAEVAAIHAAGESGKCATDVIVAATPQIFRGNPGAVVPISISATNRHNPPATNLVLTVSLPQGVAVSNVRAGFGTFEQREGSLVWSLGNFPPEQRALLEFDGAFASAGVYDLSASAAFDGDDLIPANNSSAVQIDIFDGACIYPPPGLVFLHRGESMADDVTGIFLHPAFTLPSTAGFVGNAFRFDYTTVNETHFLPGALPELPEFTVEWWVRREGEGAVYFAGNDHGILMGIGNPGEFFIHHNREPQRSYFAPRGVYDGLWHHVAFAKSGQNLRFYLDGRLAHSVALTESFDLRPPYSLHGVGQGVFNRLVAQVDELSVFNRGLSDQEILDIFLAGANGKCREDSRITAATSLVWTPIGEANIMTYAIANRGAQAATGVTFALNAPQNLQVGAVTGADFVREENGVRYYSTADIPAGAIREIAVEARPLALGRMEAIGSFSIAQTELTLFNNTTTAVFDAVRLRIIVGPDATAAESARTLSFNVTLSPPSENRNVIPIRWVAETASLGSDFSPITTELVFEPGATTATAQFRLLNDWVYEGTETFRFEIVPGANYDLDRGAATFVITEDDRAPVLRVNDVRVSEGSGLARFNVRMEGAFAGSIDVPYATPGLNAVAGEDFTGASGSLTFTPDERERSIEVLIIDDASAETAEAFELTLTGPGRTLRPRGIILDNDAPAASRLVWGPLAVGPGGNTVMTSLTARHADGSIDVSANGPVGLSAARGEHASAVVISEIEHGRDSVEIQNVGRGEANISEWRVYFYDQSKWPSPAMVYTFPADTVLAERGLTFLLEGTTPQGAGILLGGNLLWADTPAQGQPIAALLTDAGGNLRDFIAVEGARGEEIIDPYPVRLPNWSIPLRVDRYIRTGAGNNFSTNDWVSAGGGGTIGILNTQLVLPFSNTEFLPVEPATITLVNGEWSGEITQLPPLGIRLVATSADGKFTYSEHVPRTVSNDLALTFTQRDPYIYGGRGQMVLTVRNSGPEAVANVVADLFLPQQLSQGGVNAFSQGGIAGATGTPGGLIRNRANLGTIAAGASATWTRVYNALPTTFDIFSPTVAATFTVRAEISGPASDPDLSNNSVATLNEISGGVVAATTPLKGWWPGEMNGIDATGRNPATIGPAGGFSRGKAGFAFQFNGSEASAVRVPDHPSLDMAAGEDMLLEFWFYVESLPTDGIIELARKLAPTGNGNETGWRVWADNGSLYAYAKSPAGNPAIAFIASINPVVKFRQWQHVMILISRTATDGTMQIYLDGHNQPTATVGAEAIDNDEPIVFGAGLIGMIDEPSISIGNVTAPLPNFVLPGGQGKRPMGADSDGDGIFDAWDDAAALGLLPAWLDADGDGYVGWQEAALGTSPTDASSTLRISTFYPPNTGAIQMSFAALPGRGYVIERTTTLGPGAVWAAVSTRRTVTSPQTVTISFPRSSVGFFRVITN